jgi:acyl-coenzyme A synthetase/AMP-(fatty) acid ligase
MNFASVVLSQKSDEESIFLVKPNGATSGRSVNRIKQRVHNLSTQLLSAGVRSGDSVLIFSSNRIEAIEAMLAVIYIGAVAVPVSPQFSVGTQVLIAEDMRPRAVISDAPVADELRLVVAQNCTLWISIDEGLTVSSHATRSYEDLASRDAGAVVNLDHDASTVAIVLYSSGSTGIPKAIVRTHRVMELYVKLSVELISKARLNRIGKSPQVVPLPISHLGGSGICMIGLYLGRPIYIMKVFTPNQYLQLISSTRADSLMLIPSMYSLLMREKNTIAELDLSAVKYCYHVGEASSDALATEVASSFGAVCTSTYGMTECMSGLGYQPDELEIGNVRIGSCGHHLFGEHKLVDDRGQEQATFGELWVRNQTVEPCYRNAMLNEKRFSGGWFRTGDLFARDGEGYFYWRGRADDMFVSKGNNLYPSEIEAKIVSHPAVAGVCVAPIVDRHGMTMPAAMVVLRSVLSTQELREYLVGKVTTRAMPVFMSNAEAVPILGPGKVDRKAVAAMLQQQYEVLQGS